MNIIIDESALSRTDVAKLRIYNGLSSNVNPTIVTTVDSNGDSEKFLVPRDIIEFIIQDTPRNYIIRK